MMSKPLHWRSGLRKLGRVGVGVLTRPLAGAVRLMRLARRQAVAAWKYRAVRCGLGGLPALLVGAGAVVLIASAGVASRADLVARYEQQAIRAFQDGDYPSARAHFQRLAQLQDYRPETQYRTAVTAQALGQLERAAAIMVRLAPLDRQGYAPAHLWQARHLLTGAAGSPADPRAAELHLRRALQGQPSGLEAHALLGLLCRASGRLDQAEKHLAKAVEAWPDLRFPLADLYKAQGKKDLARAEAEMGLQFCRQRAEADPGAVDARLRWASALTFVEDYAGAVAVLRPGLSRPEAEQYRPALAKVYATWSDARKQAADSTPRDRLALLEEGLSCAPEDADLLQRLVHLTRADGPGADEARAAWRRVAARQEGSAVVQTLLGMEAWEDGKPGEARRHFERALQLSPGLPVAANNLAWALAHTEPVDLPRALALIDGARKGAPNQITYQETRGQILARMGRWREALADLEAALPAFPDNRQLHRTLAEVYEHLGLTEMAADHKRLAQDNAPVTPRP
jgi:tetratricopeptide (TPR) repeat protein